MKWGEPAARFAPHCSVFALSPHRSAAPTFESSGPRRIGARGNSIIGTGRRFSDHLVGGSAIEGWGAAALPP